VPDLVLVPHVQPAGTLSRRPQTVPAAGALVLRSWRAGDGPALVAAYADRAVQHWNGQRLDEAEAQAYADEWAEHWRAERRALRN
jgi:hypothetical protein